MVEEEKRPQEETQELSQEEIEEQEAQEVLNFLWELRKQEREKGLDIEPKLDPTLEERVEKFAGRLEEIKNPDISDEEINEMVEERREVERAGFMDVRKYVMLPNRSEANRILISELTENLDPEKKPNLEKYKRIVRFDLDIEDFKLVNEYFGHDGGDEVLRELCFEVLPVEENGDKHVGDSIKWLQESGAIKENGIVSTSEGKGEEFGGVILFKDEFEPIKVEDGESLTNPKEVMDEFVRRIDSEVRTKFEKLFKSEKVNVTEEAQKKGVIKDFVPDIGANFGYISADKVLKKVDVTGGGNSFDLVDSVRGLMLKTSDGAATAEKKLAKERRKERADAGNEMSRLTYELSPRGEKDRVIDLSKDMGQVNRDIINAYRKYRETTKQVREMMSKIKDMGGDPEKVSEMLLEISQLSAELESTSDEEISELERKQQEIEEKIKALESK